MSPDIFRPIFSPAGRKPPASSCYPETEGCVINGLFGGNCATTIGCSDSTAKPWRKGDTGNPRGCRGDTLLLKRVRS